MEWIELFHVLGQLFLVRALIFLDYLVVYSVIFALLYLACVGSESIFPHARPMFMPLYLSLLPLVAAAIFVSPIGDRITTLLIDLLNLFRMIPGELPNWQLIMASIWLAGCGYRLFRFTKQCYRLCVTLPNLPDCHDEAILSHACKQVGIRGKAIIKFAGPHHSVASWGILRATVVVPDDFLSRFTHEERYYSYLHELTHYARRDSLRYVLVTVWRAVFWFDPVSKRATAHYLRNLEIQCDTTMISKYNVNVMEYAKLITTTASLQNGMLPGLSSGYLEVRQRLGHLFHDANLLRSSMSRRAACVVAVGLVIITWYCSTVSPVGVSYMPPIYSTRVGSDGVERTFKNIPVVHRGVFGTYARSSIEQVEGETLPPQ